MDFLITYAVIAGAIAGTSYFTLYRSAIELTEEILDEDLPKYKGWMGIIFWLSISFIFAPLTAFMLLKNDNRDFIDKLALVLANRIIEEEEK